MKSLVLVLASSLIGCGAASVANTSGNPAQNMSTEEPGVAPVESTQSENALEEAPLEVPVEEAPKEPEPLQPLPTGTTVLHVGSSTAAALGLDLKRELEDRGIKCIVRAKEATYIPQWAGIRMGFREMVSGHNPDLVIVSLGGNEVAMPDPTIRADPIRRIVKIIGDRPCVWVGTPKWEGLAHTGIIEVIRENIAPCSYIDSDALVPNIETLSDKIHPTMAERRRWARRVIQWLEHNRDPNGARPWDFKEETVIPPAE